MSPSREDVAIATPMPFSGNSGTRRVLVCDDEKNMRRLITDVLEDDGCQVVSVASAEEALEALSSAGEFEALVLDLSLPGMNGIELLARMDEREILVPVVVITAFATVDTAVKAMKAGASDFLVKPFDNARLRSSLRKLRESQELLQRVRLVQPRVASPDASSSISDSGVHIVSHDTRLKEIFRIVRQVASTRACVLITGESGTGKELVAQAIHYNGNRRDKPFVPINCAALPETLLESEFFGHERGSFTGAFALQKGRFELADGGTLFLDEAGDMPLSLQVKLLRVIQDGRFTRVGGETEISVDLRIIAATNRNLQDMIRQRTFREDLFFRLNVIPIHLPPLRDRRHDIPHLVEAFQKRFAARHRMAEVSISTETMQALMEYSWPGNIRELQNCVEKAVVLQNAEALLPSFGLPEPDRTPITGINTPTRGSTIARIREGEYVLSLGAPGEIRPLADVAADAQRASVIRALKLTSGNKAEAAKRLDISYKTLFNKIHDLEIQVNMSIE